MSRGRAPRERAAADGADMKASLPARSPPGRSANHRWPHI